ncbi:MAG: carboxypeptidase M32 [Thermoplasmatota archaeon]
MSTFDDFMELSKKIKHLRRYQSLAGWDERTYMPEGSVEGRSDMKATLSSLIHKKLTSERMKKYLNELNKPSVHDELDEVQKAQVREMQRQFDKNYKVPDDLVREIAKTASKAQKAWERSYKKSDFQEFLPYLEKQVELYKKKAEYIDYENEPYDAHLDTYEPGLTAEKVERVFDPMKKKLSSFVERIFETDIIPGEGVFDGKKFDADAQFEISKKITKQIGFDYNQGRLDEAVHPFTIGMEDDVRITNRYNEEDLSSLFSAMHEAGHGLYEQGFPPELYGTPICNGVSMGFHESQSRMWENFVGRSREFIDYLYPMLTEHYPSLKEHSEEEYYRAINRIKPSFIRVEADEATYNLHIALRFDIELGMFRDEIEPEETKTIWENKMDDYFGIVPEDPSKGVLQDIHWSAGQFGYFPSYALGNLYAAQIFDQAQDEMNSVRDKFSDGEFSHLLDWLRDNIHQYGRQYEPEDMITKLTGERLSEDYYIEYLKDKYSPIYGL